MNLLDTLLQRLDEPLVRHNENDAYYSGRQPLATCAGGQDRARQPVGPHGQQHSPAGRDRLAERLRVTGFTGAEADDLWADWIRNDLDQQPVSPTGKPSPSDPYVIVWADPSGQPR